MMLDNKIYFIHNITLLHRLYELNEFVTTYYNLHIQVSQPKTDCLV